MPPRLQLLKKCYSITELPVLPFLAPRLFESCPNNRYKFTPNAQAVRNHSVAVPLDYDNEHRAQQGDWKGSEICYIEDQQQREKCRDGNNRYESNVDDYLDRDKPTVSRHIRRIYPKNGRRASRPTLLERRTPMKSMWRPTTSIPRSSRQPTPVQRGILSTSNNSGLPSGRNRTNEKSRYRPFGRRLGSGDFKNELKPMHKPTGSLKTMPGLRRDHPICQVQNSKLSPQDNQLMERRLRHSIILRRIWSENRLHWRKEIRKLAEINRWHRLMVSLERIHPGLVDHDRNRKGQLPTVLIFPSDVTEMLQLEPIKCFKEVWLALPIRRRLAVWPKLMIATLARHPGKALHILEATYTSALPHLYITDTLHCIITHHLRQRECSQDSVLNLSNRICDLLLSSLPGEPPKLNQTSIYMLLRSLPEMALKEFYLTLVKLKNHLSNDTLIQFASRLAKGGNTDLAFDISHRLEDLQESDTAKVLSLFTTLLYNSRLNPAAQHRESDIFQLLQEFGLTPNIITYNVLILNAIKDDDSETPWKIHDMMIGIGIEPDEFTYSILLNDAKRRMDLSTMERVMDLVLKRNLHTAHIFTDVLHAIHLLSLVRNGGSSRTSLDFETVFEQMLQVYCNHFHTELLVQIIPQLSRHISPPTNPDIIKNLLTPTHATINVMLTGFLYFGQASQAQRWYAHFHDLVISGDPIVKDFMKEPYVYNIILLVFRRHPHLRNEAPRIVADMLAATEESEDERISLGSHIDAEKADSSKIGAQVLRAHTPPKPNVYTWTILLQIYMMQGHSRAAEKVLAMMVRRNVKPDLVTWNALIAGYSRLQDVGKTADAVRRLEAAGFKPDDNTYKLLGGIGDREALSRALGEKKVLVEADFMKKLQQDVLAGELEKRMRESY